MTQTVAPRDTEYTVPTGPPAGLHTFGVDLKGHRDTGTRLQGHEG